MELTSVEIVHLLVRGHSTIRRQAGAIENFSCIRAQEENSGRDLVDINHTAGIVFSNCRSESQQKCYNEVLREVSSRSDDLQVFRIVV